MTRRFSCSRSSPTGPWYFLPYSHSGYRKDGKGSNRPQAPPGPGQPLLQGKDRREHPGSQAPLLPGRRQEMSGASGESWTEISEQGPWPGLGKPKFSVQACNSHSAGLGEPCPPSSHCFWSRVTTKVLASSEILALRSKFQPMKNSKCFPTPLS